MFLPMVHPEIFLPPCDHTRETVNIIGRCMNDLSPVMPYLNAVMSRAAYQGSAHILRFRFEGHPVTLQPHEIAVGGFADGDEAVAMLTRVQQLINETWDRRQEITPSTLERRRLQALEVYKLLPRTNCGACGETTCFVFANKLAAGKVGIDLCAPICQDDALADARGQLMAMLELAA